MSNERLYDVIIIGGSYSGLAAAMALGRALRHVLVIDSGKPCNRQTPHSHNFLTRDGIEPAELSAIAKKQVAAYKTVSFIDGIAAHATRQEDSFEIITESKESFRAKKLVIATGIKDVFPDVPGIAECWGISAIHCPYCHGYEVHSQKTGILANGDIAFEFGKLISNWTKELTIFTNGSSTLTDAQKATFDKHDIKVNEKKLRSVEHHKGMIKALLFEDGTSAELKALYVKPAFEHQSAIPAELGCELTEPGFIKVDGFQKTTVAGVYACGDNCSGMRSIANAVATGATAGAVLNKELVEERFQIV